MPHSRSALKRVRQNSRRRAHNRAVRSTLRTQLKKLRQAIGRKSPEASSLLKQTTKLLDRAAARRIIHKNAAARYKSRLTRQQRSAAATT
jgi:small subunit ribosomal protein S20